jgi:hypothetical protein
MPHAEVFAFFADGENDPRWRPAVTMMRRDGPVAVGTRYIQRMEVRGREYPADFEITVLDPDERVAFRNVDRLIEVEGGYTFSPAAGGTSVTFRLGSPVSGLKKLLVGKVMQKTLDAQVACLDKAKAILESGG